MGHPEIRLIATRHLVLVINFGWVYERSGCHVENYFGLPVFCPGECLGFITSGPDLPIDDLDIIHEWSDLQDYVSSKSRR